MRRPLGMGAVAGIALLAMPVSALADDSPPFDSAIDIQTFEYAVGPKTFFTVSDADVADQKQLAVDFLLTFLTKPFKIYNVDDPKNPMVGGTRTTVVNSLLAGQLTGAYGVNEKLQIGANLPLIFSLQGDGLDPKTGNGVMGGLSVTGLGDLYVEGKYRLYKKGAVKVAGIGGITLPSSIGSDGSKFIGDDLPTLSGRMAVQYDTGSFSVGANGGVLLRKPRTIYDSTVGPALTWGVAAAVKLTDRFSLIGESYGRAGFNFSLDASPLEVEGGLRLYATGAVAVVLGGGAGLMRGIGSPESRFFLSVGYAPDVRDSDGDGIPNGRDKCPLIPEDRDGFEDEDGCPDDDNDGDRRPDATDKCPDQAEDLDGFDDDDGCPELDNDRDGIPDLQDKCPMEPEDGKAPYPKDGCPGERRDSDGDGISDAIDKCPQEAEDEDGFEDGDGCPELDNDGDGVPDSADKCPLVAEDKDGFEDADGCPDLDNDHDGVLDAKDKCPTEPETINGVKDDDGCPDTGGVTLAKLDGDRLTIDRAPTLDGKSLSSGGKQIADQIALVMISHSEVTKWLLALSQPSAADAKKLGDAVKAYLATRGVTAQIELLAAAGAPKVGGVVQERAAEDAAPVFPPSMMVKPDPAKSLTPAQAAAKVPQDAPAAKPEPKKAADKPAEPEIEIEPDGN